MTRDLGNIVQSPAFASLATVYQPQLTASLGMIVESPAFASAGKVVESQIARMTRDLGNIVQSPAFASLATVYQPQLTASLGMIVESPAFASAGKVVESQIARMTRDLGNIVQSPAFASLGNMVEPLLTDLLALEDLEPSSPNINTILSNGDQRLRKLSDREVAAMLTVAAFLFVYFSLGLLIKHNAQIAEIAAADGPTPFEAAMAAGALVFWLRMNNSGRTKGK